MDYTSICLPQIFSIDRIYSIHYFEYMSNFHFTGESHDFWEFLYVDKGEVLVTSQDQKLTLHQGQVIFHKPNEFHNVEANGIVAPNLIVISFSCKSPSIGFFHDRIASITQSQKRILANLLAEARNSFASPLDNPYQNQLLLKDEILPGSLQMIASYLEQFLILLMRSAENQTTSTREFEPLFDKSEALYETILTYFHQNISSHLTTDQICKDNLISEAQLKKMFHKHGQCGAMEFFNRLKIEKAKELIRTRQFTFSQIADQLGYSSIHYFSRQFKKITGMSPTEYTESVLQLASF